MEECKHEVVLAIYDREPHTKHNIHHFLCPKCGKKETHQFGDKIKYDHEEELTSNNPNKSEDKNE